MCKQSHTETRQAYQLWCVNNKPEQGPIYNMMVKSRALFTSFLRKYKRDKEQHIAASLSKRFYSDMSTFWKEAKHIVNVKAFSSVINGTRESKKKILDNWVDHYSSIMNKRNDSISVNSKLNDITRSLFQIIMTNVLLKKC